MSLLKFEELYLDREIEAIENEAISKVQLVKYAGASGDFNPLHTDDQFAKKAGLDGVIAHGMLSMGLIGKYVRQVIGDQGNIEQIQVRFSSMAKPQDVLTCTGKVASIEEESKTVIFDVAAINQEGRTVTAGSTVVRYFVSQNN